MTHEEAEWRLTEPGLWALDGTDLTIRMSTGGVGLYYFLHWKGSMLTGAFTLNECKKKVARYSAELQEAGFEP